MSPLGRGLSKFRRLRLLTEHLRMSSRMIRRDG